MHLAAKWNDYAWAVRDLEALPKAVWMALAVSYAARVAEDANPTSEEGARIVAAELIREADLLVMNGILPKRQAPTNAMRCVREGGRA